MADDLDYQDISNLEEEGLEEEGLEEGLEEGDPEEEGLDKNKRGKDVQYEVIADFLNNQEYDESEVKAEIKKYMNRRKAWKTDWAMNHNYCCKYQNKPGFKKCPRILNVCFISSCHSITVFSNMEEHWHKEDLKHVTKVNYHWTGPQIEVIGNHIKYAGKNNNQVILRQLIEGGLCNGAGKYPTAAQVGTKKRNMKKTKKKYQVLTIEDLVKICEKNHQEPDNEDHAYMFLSTGLKL